MKGRTYVRTYVRTVDDVMAIKPNFLASMGYQYFLSYGATRARRRRARNSAIIKHMARSAAKRIIRLHMFAHNDLFPLNSQRVWVETALFSGKKKNKQNRKKKNKKNWKVNILCCVKIRQIPRTVVASFPRKLPQKKTCTQNSWSRLIRLWSWQFSKKPLQSLLTPGGRFSKDPVTYRARKAILETMIRLPWKAALLICFRYKEMQNTLQVSKLEICTYWRSKGIYVTRKVSGRSRNGPQAP